jgi:hypothetical protein
LNAIGSCSGLVQLFLLLGLLGKITEDVVQYEVTVGLLGEDECLGETLVGVALIGDLADDLNDNVGLGALGVDVGDANLGVLEVLFLDARDILGALVVEKLGPRLAKCLAPMSIEAGNLRRGVRGSC